MILDFTKKIIERKYKLFSISNRTLISSILIVTTILTPLGLIPREVEAQQVSARMVSISSLPQCSNTDKSTRALFRGTVGALSAAISGADTKTSLTVGGISAGTGYLIDSATEALTKELKPENIQDKIDDAMRSSTSVQVVDEGLNKKVDKLKEQTDKIEASTSKEADNSTCIAAIGRIITKMLLQKITLSTINWINGGFDGSPSFIQDPGKFFLDLAKSEVLQFNDELITSGSPFAKTWIKNTVSAFNSKFQDNAAYSLDKMIKNTTPQYSDLTFQADFSQGGWNAWNAITQAPQNNPLGFQLMADGELQKRLDGTVKSTGEMVGDALSQANGFLGDQRCADPEGVTKEQDRRAREEKRRIELYNYNLPEGGTKKITSTVDAQICKAWQYVTPGSMIAKAATDTIGLTKDSLLSAQDLNDAIEAVMNALLAKFSSTLMEKGFAALDENEIYSKPIVIAGINDSNNGYQSQTEKDFLPSQLSSSWLSSNPEFNIRTDLTQALIDEQRTYSDKLAQQNKELNSTTDDKPYALSADKKSSNAYGLIPVIHQLDYCIPGPHPGWQDDAQTNLTNIFSSSSANISSGDSGPSFVDVVVNSIPFVGGLIGALFADDAGEQTYEARNQYADIVYNLIGFRPRVRKSLDNLEILDSRLTSKDGIIYITNQILHRYAQIMNKTYFSLDMLPPIAKEAAVTFNQLPGYFQIIQDNEDKINLLKTTLNILGDIKKAVNDLNTEYKDEEGRFKSGKSEEGYENKLKAQINAFGRISANMVNGDDIANADNLSKQIVDKKNYLYKDLLKGPYGCEKFLENLDKLPVSEKNFPSAQPGVGEISRDWNNYNVNTVKRISYPYPILYDYNSFETAGDLLPDPLNKPQIYNNKTPVNSWTTFAQGFLTFVHLTRTDSGYNPYAGSERLNISDLIDTYGRETSQFMNVPLGRFENTIGIY